MSVEDNLDEPLLERLSASPEPKSTKEQLSSKKRKRSSKTEKTPKNISKKHKSEDNEELDLEAGLNLVFSHMDAQLLADHVAQKTRRFENELSSVELEDKYISAKAIRDTTSYDKIRNLENLPSYLEKFSTNPTKLWSASKKNGSPHTIVVAGAGLRASELARAVRKFQSKDSKVAKLFAKHIKIEDSIKFLKSCRTGMAVGTPIRLNDLMNEGALAVDRLERIVIDASHIDQKKRGILDMKETQVPLAQWLNRKEFKERYTASSDKIELLFY